MQLNGGIFPPGKHWRGWEGVASVSDTGCGHRRHCSRVSTVSFFSFFFFSDSRRLSFDSRWFGQNQIVLADNWNSRKKAKIVRATSRMTPPSSTNLHLGFFLAKKLKHHHSHSGFLLHPLSLSLCWSALLFIFSSFLYFFIQSASGLGPLWFSDSSVFITQYS